MEITPESSSYSIFIVGRGKVGSALFTELSRATQPPHVSNISISLVSGRAFNEKDFFTTDLDLRGYRQIIILTVPDSAIRVTATKILELNSALKNALFLHTSGIESSVLFTELGLEGASLHPAMSVKGKDTTFQGKLFGVEGSEQAVKGAEKIIALLKATSLKIGPKQKTTYHLAATLATNFVQTLLDEAAGMFQTIGIDEKNTKQLIDQLCKSVMHNDASEKASFKQMITGPAARGDQETLQRHQEALVDNPKLLDVYKSLTALILEKIVER